jgi:metallo-beta-lactamase family protein
MQQSKLIFYGGAGAVTGSNFMIDTGGAKFLVDCGLRQGREDDEAQNWDKFAYDPVSVSHLIISHAHIDHVGRIPKLVRDGFKGVIISTHATKALAEPLLHDAMHISELNARREGREALYEEKDIDAAMKLWQAHGYHEKISLPDGVTLELLNAGHILGSSMSKFTRGEHSLVITGDLGGGNSPLITGAEDLININYLVMESVYGDRVRREDKDRREMLEDVIEDAAARGGTLLIPAFSTERTQDLLYEIRALMMEKRVPDMVLYVDSPLAEKITGAFLAAPEYFAPDIRTRVEAGENIFLSPQMHFVETPEDSRNLASAPNPKIILAGSGMGTGGRVGTHEHYVLPDKNSTILMVGYQAAGTIGRRLIEGEKKIRLGKDWVPVNCTVQSVYGYSAHMDGEALLEFANKAAASGQLKQIFVVEGEPAAAMFLAQRIRDYLGTKATTPEAGDSVTIDF